jgi:lactose/L-arabinose transport system permease protein
MATAARPGYRRYYDVNGWFFVGPAIALIGVFMAYPIVSRSGFLCIRGRARS